MNRKHSAITINDRTALQLHPLFFLSRIPAPGLPGVYSPSTVLRTSVLVEGPDRPSRPIWHAGCYYNKRLN